LTPARGAIQTKIACKLNSLLDFEVGARGAFLILATPD
jgi:hypothetical protein